MGYDGSLKFDTAIDSKGFQSGLATLGSVAKTGLKATLGILTGVSGAILGIGAYATSVGSQFEAGMSEVQAISGATGSELDKLADKAKEMGAKTKFSASESADAFKYMAMAGWDTSDMLGSIEGVMNLAAASGADLATTSDILTDAMTALGIAADGVTESGVANATHFADVIAAASSNANTNVELMGETFKYAATMAGTLGYSAEDTALAIGLMANSGIKGSMAGTALSSIMTRLSTNTRGARDAVEELGIEFYNEDGTARNLNDVMKDLRKATADMTTEQKASIAKTIAGQEAQKGLLAILNASEADYGKLESAIYSCDGAAKNMADTLNDNLKGKVTLAKSALEGLGVSLYDNIEQPMKEAVETVTDEINRLNSSTQNGGLDGFVGGLGQAFANIAVDAAKEAPNLARTAGKLIQSFAQGIVRNKNQLKTAGRDLVKALAEVLISLLPKRMQESAQKAVKAFSKAFKTDAKIAINAAQTLLNGLVKVLDFLGDHMDSLLPVINGLVASFITFKTVNGPVGSAVSIITKLVTASTEGAGAVASIASALGLANPMVLAITASIAALVGTIAFFVSAGEQVSDSQQTLRDRIDDTNAAVERQRQASEELSATMQSTMSSIDSQVAPLEKWKGMLGQCFEESGHVKEGCEDMANAILGELNNAMGTNYSITADGFIAKNDEIMGSIGDLIGDIGAYIAALKRQAVMEAVKDDYAEAVKGKASAMSTYKTAVADYNKALEDYNKAAEAATKATGDNSVQQYQLSKAQADAKATLEQADSALQEAALSAADYTSKVETMDAVFDGFAEGTATGSQRAVDAYANMDTAATEAVDNIRTRLEEADFTETAAALGQTANTGMQSADMAFKFGTLADTAIKDADDKLRNADLSAASSKLGGTANKGLVGANMPNAFGTEVNTSILRAKGNLAGSSLSSEGKQLGQSANTGVKDADMPTAYGNEAKKAANKAKSELTSVDVNSSGKSVGKNMIQGMIDGIGEKIGGLAEAARNAAKNALNAAKNALNIQSPSKRFRDEVGKMIPAGMAIGITSGTPKLLKAAKAQANQLVDAMRVGVDAQSAQLGTLSLAGTSIGGGGATYVTNNSTMNNTYNIPVATPAEIERTQREYDRKLAGGVK